MLATPRKKNHHHNERLAVYNQNSEFDSFDSATQCSYSCYDVAMAEAHAAVTGIKLDMVTLLLCGRVPEPPVRATKVLPSAVHVRAVFVVFVVVHLRCCSLALGAHKRVVRTAVSNGGKTAEGGERARRGSFHPHTL